MGRAGLRLVTGAVLVFIYFPLVLVIVYAFNRNIVASWPIPGLTLGWWERAIANPGVRDALLTSIVAGIGATAPPCRNWVRQAHLRH